MGRKGKSAAEKKRLTRKRKAEEKARQEASEESALQEASEEKPREVGSKEKPQQVGCEEEPQQVGSEENPRQEDSQESAGQEDSQERARQEDSQEKLEIDPGEGTSGAPELTTQIKEEPLDYEAQQLLEFVATCQLFDEREAGDPASSSPSEVDSPDSSQVVPSFVDEKNENVREKNENSNEATANSAPGTYEEMVCLYDSSDKASCSRPRAEVSGPRAEVSGPKAGVSGPKAGVSGPKAGVSGPKAGVSGPKAGVFKPRAGVSKPRAGVSSTRATPPSVKPKSLGKKAKVSKSAHDRAFPIVGRCVIRMDDSAESFLRKVHIEPLVVCGVIGCGPMAHAIICYLIKTGHTVYAFNRTAQKLEELPFKPSIVASPAELVEKCEVVLCCVSGTRAVRDVMQGPKGVLAGLDFFVGKVYVEMTSMHPNSITRYSQEIIARGGSYLNAQIGRTRPAMHFGCAVVSASGDRAVFKKCTSVFASFCTYAIFLSTNITEASIASISQIVTESMSIITLSDSMLAADAMRLPKEALLDVLERDPRKMAMLPVAATSMIQDRTEVFIPLKHTMKNLRMAVSLKRSDMGGNEFILSGLDICNRVIHQYPEAKDSDLTCVYKLRTPAYANPVPKD